jgi:hypothetical protein
MSADLEPVRVPAVIGELVPPCPQCGPLGDVRLRRDVIEGRHDPIFGGVRYLCHRCNRPFGSRS